MYVHTTRALYADVTGVMDVKGTVLSSSDIMHRVLL